MRCVAYQAVKVYEIRNYTIITVILYECLKIARTFISGESVANNF